MRERPWSSKNCWDAKARGGGQASVDAALDLASLAVDLIDGASDPAVYVDADRAVRLMAIRSTDRPAGHDRVCR